MSDPSAEAVYHYYLNKLREKARWENLKSDHGEIISANNIGLAPSDAAFVIRLLDAAQARLSVVEQQVEDLSRYATQCGKSHEEAEERASALERERDAWKDTAEQHCRNEFFYHDLVTKIGEPFGVAAKTSDDGSVQQDVLALKVPELVEQLRERASALTAALTQLVAVIDAAGLLNLMRGVQLGPTVWLVKATEATAHAREALAQSEAPVGEPRGGEG